MGLRKAERHEIYKKVLAQVKKEKWRAGFCFHLSRFTEINTYEDNDLKKNFPEIWKRKPKKMYSSHYWFKRCWYGEDPVREKILKLAIKETKPKSNVIPRGKTVAKRRSIRKSPKGNRGVAGVGRVSKKRTKTR